MRKSFSRIMTLTLRNLKEIVRDPVSLIFLLALPLVMEILFYFLFHNMTSQFEMKYLAPGIVVFSQAFLSLFSGQLIAVDRASSFLTRLFVSRARSFEFILGYAFALVPISLFQSVLFYLVGGIIDPSIFCIGMVWGILASVLTSLLFMGLGIMLGSLCTERSVGGVASVIISAQSLLSGMWFPVENMNAGFLTLMNCLPFKNATVLVQNSLNGIGDTFDDFLKPLLIVLGYTLLAFISATIFFRRKMKSQ